jgi:hypothetical protein
MKILMKGAENKYYSQPKMATENYFGLVIACTDRGLLSECNVLGSEFLCTIQNLCGWVIYLVLDF